MAHTYVITSATTTNDVCTITGTVDGTAYTIQVWASAIAKYPTALALEGFLAPLMLAAAFPPQPATQTSVTSLGTFTQ